MCIHLSFCFRAIFVVFIYGFGALVTNLFTDIGKKTVGQLRPYFLAVCKPNNCSQGFVTGDVCTGNPEDIQEARSVASVAIYIFLFNISINRFPVPRNRMEITYKRKTLFHLEFKSS